MNYQKKKNTVLKRVNFAKNITGSGLELECSRGEVGLGGEGEIRREFLLMESASLIEWIDRPSGVLLRLFPFDPFKLEISRKKRWNQCLSLRKRSKI
jgi:hypothetical protein